MKAYINDIFLSSTNGMYGNILTATLSYGQTGTFAGYAVSGGTNYQNGCFAFYQGVFPTNAEMNTFNFTTSRTTDLLAKFTTSFSAAYTMSRKRLTLNFGSSNFATIIKDGTLGWFRIGPPQSTSAAIQLFGTIGLIGSGADLELNRVTITTTESWLCTGLYFDLSNEITYAP